ncbi:GNAT family N-acetyltransferase [Arthrobacter sp. EH-1B-1]|uniref:GNAT family N-acetyltransferase n=1 Tax=Arthrobacter vasquezii TaxID=2977629 RepID=A0ABT6CZ04_9MICC|nr:GNAT family N-acetyltransferase [Arthrobacter vasquezii]MDF9279278.1 GNAT family N-acetyltransferase [Arthrobacter vasquezii]
MKAPFDVRTAEPVDVPSMAKVHVDTWRETYRGLMSDAVLDDPALLSWREKFWTAALTDPNYNRNVAAIASYEDNMIGIAMSGPSLDEANGPQQLYLLYAYAEFHGSGVGQALLNAVIDPTAPATLWVADPNPRAQAFYRKNGYVIDGAVRTDDDVRSVRMVRASKFDYEVGNASEPVATSLPLC